MGNNYLLISDAAKEIHVESHVLRYWEEELHLPIKRNELGHRYYTREDVERFQQIKSMKERGLQLKAIKMILKDGKLDVLVPEEEKKIETISGGRQTEMQAEKQDEMAINIIESRSLKETEHTSRLVKEANQETKEEKARRLQWLLQQLIKETLQENNKELCREIKESVVKEMDYQFRVQEEREEEREKAIIQRNEEYYRRMDELLRKKSRVRRSKESKMGKNSESGKNNVALHNNGVGREKQEEMGINRTFESRLAESKLKENKLMESKTTEEKTVEGKSVENKGAESTKTEDKKSESKKKKRHFIF
ncbi:helix-turn-helix domain-containing protein [Lachnospiraceae bacterium OttesenSCG-928-D06]|nr:helix-turn-helix domain-containing protein [Lachnospiraceae bacterium OttesenSCG-928-D06]